MSEENAHERPDATPEEPKPEADGPDAAVSAVLARLIEEVRNEGAKGEKSYDRVHNRHNR